MECWVSAAYHLCDSFDVCLFDFSFHHHLDFFFAQGLIVLGVLYLIDFTHGYEWVEWLLIFCGLLGVAILQATLPGELMVQAGIAGVSFAVVISYWTLWGVPKYNWGKLTMGLALLGASIILFATQSVNSSLYWLNHSLWHISASFGMDYLLQIKPPARLIDSVAWRINQYASWRGIKSAAHGRV